MRREIRKRIELIVRGIIPRVSAPRALCSEGERAVIPNQMIPNDWYPILEARKVKVRIVTTLKN